MRIRRVDILAWQILSTFLITAAVIPALSQTGPATPRSVLESQPDFVADLEATLPDNTKRTLRIAKKGVLYRLDHLPDDETMFINQEGEAWSFDAQSQSATPIGHPMVSLIAPWILFHRMASAPEVRIDAVGTNRDREGRPTTIAVSMSGEDDGEMRCYVSGSKGLVTRIELPLSQEQIGAKRYELKKIRYEVPDGLFGVHLPAQRSMEEGFHPK